MLVDPKPYSLKNLDPWRNFRARVGQLSAAELEAIADELCHGQETAYSPLAKRVRQQLDGAREEDDLARELVRIALWLGDLLALASYPTKDKALARHGKPEIFNTDQGSQFTAARRTRCPAKPLCRPC
jgi:putative transposase